MKIYRPIFSLGVLMPEQAKLEDKIGGYPWGFPQNLWPYCISCKKPMNFFAQFCHHPQRLDLGKKGRALYLFQCDKLPCGFDDSCQQCFVLEAHELTSGITPPPESTFIETELRIPEWITQEEDVTLEMWELCTHPEAYFKVSHDEFNEFWDKVYCDTKLGGVATTSQIYDFSGFTFLGLINGGVEISLPETISNREVLYHMGCDYNYWGSRSEKSPFPKKPGVPRYITIYPDGREKICSEIGYGAAVICRKNGQSDKPEICFFWDCD